MTAVVSALRPSVNDSLSWCLTARTSNTSMGRSASLSEEGDTRRLTPEPAPTLVLPVLPDLELDSHSFCALLDFASDVLHRPSETTTTPPAEVPPVVQENLEASRLTEPNASLSFTVPTIRPLQPHSSNEVPLKAVAFKTPVLNQKRPLSVAVEFTIGPPDGYADESDQESPGDKARAHRLSYNGHQEDHLAALQRLARNSPSSASPLTSTLFEYGLKAADQESLESRLAEAPYKGPFLPTLPTRAVNGGSLDIPAHVQENTAKTDVKRGMIVKELLETERMYVNDLRILVESFFDRLSAVSWLPNDKKFSLMRNASELYKFQQEFLNTLEDSLSQHEANSLEALVSLANVFLNMEERFKVYAQYCTQHDSAVEILNEYQARPEMVTFIKDFRGIAKTKLDVKDYLIKPVQRLCRYPLLLHEIIRNTPAEAAPFQDLLAAHTVMQTVALEIDSAKWRMENMQRTDRFFTRLEGPIHGIPSRLDIGDIVISGALYVANHDQYSHKLRYRGVFVFPDYIFVVKPRRVTAYTLKLCLALTSCEFRILAAHESPFPNAWRLTYSNNGIYYDFGSYSEKERYVWVDVLSRLATSAQAAASMMPTDDGPSVFEPPVDVDETQKAPLPRTESVGSCMSSASSNVSHPDTGCTAGPPPAVAPRKSQRAFWRQSTTDLRIDGLYDSNMNGGPLARRPSVDIRLMDVLTPLPVIDHGLASAHSQLRTSHRDGAHGESIIEPPINHARATQTLGRSSLAGFWATRHHSEPSILSKNRESRLSVITLHRLTEEPVTDGPESPASISSEGSVDNYLTRPRTSSSATRSSRSPSGVPRAVAATLGHRGEPSTPDAGVYIPARSADFNHSAPLLNRYPSRSSISSWISDRSDASTAAVVGPAAVEPTTEHIGMDKGRRQSLVRRTFSQIFHPRKGLKEALGMKKAR
ncbi:hypothetical protein BC832DRAFT_590639 [Gaertneriomyces semiglobifer]|nr:hypothetical protein BC832DRAFT_590639 [Gaertneriomyces semiglobifer]